jgi:hypothetical protein
MEDALEYRRMFEPIIIKLTHRVDKCSELLAKTGETKYLTEYNKLVKQICDIKEMIVKHEEM